MIQLQLLLLLMGLGGACLHEFEDSGCFRSIVTVCPGGQGQCPVNLSYFAPL